MHAQRGGGFLHVISLPSRLVRYRGHFLPSSPCRCSDADGWLSLGWSDWFLCWVGSLGDRSFASLICTDLRCIDLVVLLWWAYMLPSIFAAVWRVMPTAVGMSQDTHIPAQHTWRFRRGVPWIAWRGCEKEEGLAKFQSILPPESTSWWPWALVDYAM